MNENKAYLLGVMKGDGCAYSYNAENKTRYAIQLQVTEKRFAECFKNILEEEGLNPTFCPKIYKYRGESKKSWFVFIYKTEPFYLWELFNQPIDQLKDSIVNNKIRNFIKGIYESEGGYYKNDIGGNILIVYIGIEEELAKFVKNCLESIGFKTNFSIQKQSEKSGSNKDLFKVNVLGGSKEHIKFFKTIKPVIKYPQIGKCKNCGIESLENFCSHSCATKYNKERKGEYRKCEWCSKENYYSPSEIDRNEKKRKGIFFCNKEHFNKWQRAVKEI